MRALRDEGEGSVSESAPGVGRGGVETVGHAQTLRAESASQL